MQSRQHEEKNMVLLKNKVSDFFFFVWMNAYAISWVHISFSFMQEPGWPQGWGGGQVWLRGHFSLLFFPSPHSAVVTSELWKNNTARTDGGLSCDLTTCDTLVGSSCEQTTPLLLLLLMLLQPLHQPQPQSLHLESASLFTDAAMRKRKNICTLPGLISSQPHLPIVAHLPQNLIAGSNRTPSPSVTPQRRWLRLPEQPRRGIYQCQTRRAQDSPQHSCQHNLATFIISDSAAPGIIQLFLPLFSGK